MKETVIWSARMVTNRNEVIHTPKMDEWLTDLFLHDLARNPEFEKQTIVSARKEREPDVVLLARVRQELNDIIKGVENGA
jgi:hypothetical protein